MLSVRALSGARASLVDPSLILSPSSVKRIALFAATRWEYAAVQAGLPPGRDGVIEGIRVFVGQAGSREYWLIRTGVGPEKAGRAASRLLPHQPWELAISTGFACALDSADVGDFIVATAATESGNGSNVWPVPTGLSDAARDRILALVSRMPAVAHTGSMLSLSRIVCLASEKRVLARSSGAVGLDMESAALAREASRARVPFVIVRTVSDLRDEDLPLDFNLFLRPSRWIAGVHRPVSPASAGFAGRAGWPLLT
jgi:adenosylhomocysteine nucleosidase